MALLPLLLMSCSYNILSPAAEKMERERERRDEGETPRCSRLGESYTFNCSFHGGVRDEEGRGGQSGGRKKGRQQAAGGAVSCTGIHSAPLTCKLRL